jgi:hypothetical protein
MRGGVQPYSLNSETGLLLQSQVTDKRAIGVVVASAARVAPAVTG